MTALPNLAQVKSESRLEAVGTKPIALVEPGAVESASPHAVDETLYLTGRPTLKKFLRYVRTHTVSPPDERDLTDEWQAANEIVRTLEREEAGVSDNPPIRQLELASQPLLREFLKDPLVRNVFNTVPTEIAWVELDRLVVYQKHIDLTYVRQLENSLDPALDADSIFRICLPYDHPQPPVKWSRVRHNSFVFMSPSNDLRFLGTMPMQPSHIQDYTPPGNLVGVLGLAVGFGSNFMNAIYSENRLILNNGSHRAYALRKMGFTKVPCIVQHVSSLAELDVVASTEVVEDAEYYLKHPRPSMLRDYFNPKLHKVMPVHRRLRQVTVKFEVEENFVPSF